MGIGCRGQKMKMLLAEMLKSRSVRLVLAAGFCILLQAALRFPMIAAIRTLTELTGAERMYLVHEAGRILIPFQLLPAVLDGSGFAFAVHSPHPFDGWTSSAA